MKNLPIVRQVHHGTRRKNCDRLSARLPGPVCRLGSVFVFHSLSRNPRFLPLSAHDISRKRRRAAHSGSSVIQVDWRFWSKAFSGLVGGNPGHGSVIGQGAMVDLGARGTLVAALSGLPYDYCSARAIDLVSLAYNPVDRGRNCTIGHPLSVEGEKALAQKQGVAQLPLNGMPAFIWFPDVSAQARPRGF